MGFKVFHKGDLKKTEKFLNGAKVTGLKSLLKRYGEMGVQSLKAATPKDTGELANSWGYKIDIRSNYARIIWKNSKVIDGYPIAILLQYGHATGGGGYVQGLDYINPAMARIFTELANAAWKEVTGNG